MPTNKPPGPGWEEVLEGFREAIDRLGGGPGAGELPAGVDPQALTGLSEKLAAESDRLRQLLEALRQREPHVQRLAEQVRVHGTGQDVLQEWVQKQGQLRQEADSLMADAYRRALAQLQQAGAGPKGAPPGQVPGQQPVPPQPAPSSPAQPAMPPQPAPPGPAQPGGGGVPPPGGPPAPPVPPQPSPAPGQRPGQPPVPAWLQGAPTWLQTAPPWMQLLARLGRGTVGAVAGTLPTGTAQAVGQAARSMAGVSRALGGHVARSAGIGVGFATYAVREASPTHFATLTESMNLLAARIGTRLLPVVDRLSLSLQRMATVADSRATWEQRLTAFTREASEGTPFKLVQDVGRGLIDRAFQSAYGMNAATAFDNLHRWGREAGAPDWLVLASEWSAENVPGVRPEDNILRSYKGLPESRVLTYEQAGQFVGTQAMNLSPLEQEILREQLQNLQAIAANTAPSGGTAFPPWQ